MNEPLTVWRFSDGKQGHENIALGFIDALARRRPLRVIDAPRVDVIDGVRAISGATVSTWRGLPSPAWAIGAGHRTHWSLLVARRTQRCGALVLMRPSLPVRWFDACVAPAHDRLPVDDRVFLTQGVPNRVVSPSRRTASGRESLGKSARGLILVGGPSRHHTWLNPEFIGQIKHVLAAREIASWTIADSRRTPSHTTESLARLANDNIQFVHHADVDRDWLPTQLQNHHTAWVSEDSVSMVYESLSAGLAVGLLHVPRTRPSRVVRSICLAAQETPAIFFTDWRSGTPLQPAIPPLNEAERAADWFATQFLSASRGSLSHMAGD
ncbi:MAG: ELM1/GtrOC1 family putative glycosyltransferase [Pseudomonadota bacterium]